MSSDQEILFNGLSYNITKSKKLTGYTVAVCNFRDLWITQKGTYFIMSDAQENGPHSSFTKRIIQTQLTKEEVIAFCEKCNDRQLIEKLFKIKIEEA
jgi:hypothetical protein